MWQYDCSPVNGVDIKYINVRGSNTQLKLVSGKNDISNTNSIRYMVKTYMVKTHQQPNLKM
jgi:hypothetical protein